MGGIKTAISRFIDHIDISSPLHDIIKHFDIVLGWGVFRIMRIILAYHEGCGLNRPRGVGCFTISYSDEQHLVVESHPHSTPTPNQKSALTLEFYRIYGSMLPIMLESKFSLYPLDDVWEFTNEGWSVNEEGVLREFEKTKVLPHLRLNNQEIFRALDVLCVLCVKDGHQNPH